jgi:hypothetical protein
MSDAVVKVTNSNKSTPTHTRFYIRVDEEKQYYSVTDLIQAHTQCTLEQALARSKMMDPKTMARFEMQQINGEGPKILVCSKASSYIIISTCRAFAQMDFQNRKKKRTGGRADRQFTMFNRDRNK